jgi:hypothetical protein
LQLAHWNRKYRSIQGISSILYIHSTPITKNTEETSERVGTINKPSKLVSKPVNVAIFATIALILLGTISSFNNDNESSSKGYTLHPAISSPDAIYNLAIVLVGQARSLPLEEFYPGMYENLLRPYREDGRYNVHLIFDISLQNQAINKTTRDTVDLPVEALRAAFDRSEPAHVFIHDDTPDTDMISPTGMKHSDWPNSKNSHLVGIKWVETSSIIEQYEKQQGILFDHILLSRADGLWLGRPDMNQLPESGTIHCRVINNECGYGAVDHVYLGARNDILSLMSYWNFVDLELLDKAKEDLMCGPGCFGNECILQTWINQCGISWKSDMWNVDGSAPGMPFKWNNNMEAKFFEL